MACMGYMAWALAACLACMAGLGAGAAAETVQKEAGGGMIIEIEHPESVVAGRDFAVSVLLKNEGWEAKDQVMLRFEGDGALVLAGRDAREIGRIAAGGSHGEAAIFSASEKAQEGRHFLNLKYSQVLLENNEIPREPESTSIAIPIELRAQAKVDIRTSGPESVFSDAEFPLAVQVDPRDTEITDVSVRLVAPQEMEFRGQTVHTFSSISPGEPAQIAAQVVILPQEVLYEHVIPVQVKVSYMDDLGEQKSDTQTVPLLLRPRAFAELVSGGGIWIGGFFIAPYVSIGTVAGVPAGLILSLLARRRQRGRKR